MNVQSNALEILEKNKGKEHLILDKSIIESALLIELVSHNEFGLMDLAVILSLMKQTKRKIKYNDAEKVFKCPNCGKTRRWRDGHYCKDCGQSLDWNWLEEGVVE